jgi:6-phosphogluconolactonase
MATLSIISNFLDLWQAQNEAIERRNKFTLATSGGSLPKMLAKYLIDRTDDAVRWDKW